MTARTDDLANANWQDSYEETLEYAAELGQKFTGFAWFPEPSARIDFQALAERFNEAGALAKEYGLQFFYHNHDFEFTTKQAERLARLRPAARRRTRSS